jgi:PAS domain-containing protein
MRRQGEPVMAVPGGVLETARQLAERISTPAAIFNAAGDAIFWNRAAEVLFGVRFVDMGVLHPPEWVAALNIGVPDGGPYALDATLGWANLERERPALGHVRITSLDGQERLLGSITSPLFAGEPSGAHLEGAIGLLWEVEDRTPARRLATVVYTDIVASTERATTLGDRRWLGLLEAHDRADAGNSATTDPE